MKKQNFFERKGFYIILFLCVTAIGAAGYVSFNNTDELVLENPSIGVVTKTPEVQKPDIKEEIIPEPIEKKEEIVKPDKEEKTEKTEKVVEPKVEVTKEKTSVYKKPVEGKVLNPHSKNELVLDTTMNVWRTHSATDFEAKKGSNVVAIADGTVRSITTDDLFGTVITIEHKDNVVTKIYGLNSDTTAKIDKKVVAGDVIGTAMGVFPAEEKLGEHIHVEAIKDGKPIDVEDLFK